MEITFDPSPGTGPAPGDDDDMPPPPPPRSPPAKKLGSDLPPPPAKRPPTGTPSKVSPAPKALVVAMVAETFPMVGVGGRFQSITLNKTGQMLCVPENCLETFPILIRYLHVEVLILLIQLLAHLRICTIAKRQGRSGHCQVWLTFGRW